jgi:hypothetical protein
LKAAVLAVGLALLAGISAAQEYVTAKGKLSDDDFYRLVACAAPPGGACKKPFVRWSPDDAKDLTVRIVQVDPEYPDRVARKVSELLPGTLADINATGARLQLREAPEATPPDIRVFLLDLPANSSVAGTGLPWFDGNPMQVARMQMGWRDDGTAFTCAIALSNDVTQDLVPRVLVEEIVQCLGLMTDIGGTSYSSRSIFSEQGTARSMGAQDVMALRRHYP